MVSAWSNQAMTLRIYKIALLFSMSSRGMCKIMAWLDRNFSFERDIVFLRLG